MICAEKKYKSVRGRLSVSVSVSVLKSFRTMGLEKPTSEIIYSSE